jgi:hypothetical protein
MTLAGFAAGEFDRLANRASVGPTVCDWRTGPGHIATIRHCH